MNQRQSVSNWLLFLSVFGIFSCSLVVEKSVNICFYVLLLVSFFNVFFRKQAASAFWATCKRYWPLNLAMCSTLLVVLLHQLFLGTFTLRMYDLPARLTFFALIFWSLLALPAGQLKKLQWAFACGAALYTINLYISTSGGAIRVTEINSFSVIFSSELALLMGLFALLSVGWDTPARIWTLTCMTVALLFGIGAVYFSQTRGGWMGIPFFALMVVVTILRSRSLRVKVIAYAIIFLTLTAAFSASGLVRERLREGQNDISELALNKNPDTSFGVRFQLWNASWLMFREHPLSGVGKENFNSELHAMHQRGVITELAAQQYHSHNEFLYAMATMGIGGLLAVLLTYLVPGYYFAQYLKHHDSAINASAAMGLCLTAGYGIFGLVDVMFGWNMCNVFYSVSIAVFMALIVNRTTELQNPAQQKS